MRAEFTVEPFEAGNPGAHVQAAIDAAMSSGAQVVVGPFGTTVEGDAETVLDAVDALMRAATAAGASRVTLQLEQP